MTYADTLASIRALVIEHSPVPTHPYVLPSPVVLIAAWGQLSRDQRRALVEAVLLAQHVLRRQHEEFLRKATSALCNLKGDQEP